MANLQTTYLGIPLKNPLVAASSGLTASVSKIKELEENGIAAVVLKSIFEEQISGEVNKELSKSHDEGVHNAEAYIKAYVRSNEMGQYLDLIKEVKEAVDIPVIASVNCVTGDEWTSYAKNFEKVGADAIELNIFHVPKDRHESIEDIENLYTGIVEKVVKQVNIPVSVKFSMYHTNIIKMVDLFKGKGAKGVVMFNRFYEPDFDLDKLTVTSNKIFSDANDIRASLRWVGLVSSLVQTIDIAASTGIHDSDAVIKQLLAGAQVTQLCSTIYINKPKVIKEILKGLETFMDEKQFATLKDFRGKLSYSKTQNPLLYERAQFMKYYTKNND